MKKAFNLTKTKKAKCFNLYRFSQSPPVSDPNQANPASDPNQTGQQNAPNVNQADQEVQQSLGPLQQYLLNFIIKNTGNYTVEYLMDPTPQNRDLLARYAVMYVVEQLAEQIGMGLPLLLKFMPIEKAIDHVPTLRNLVANMIQYISQNINIGMIPDDISSQSEALRRFDISDNISQRLAPALQNLDPQSRTRLIMIILRIQDNQDLLDTQFKMLGL